MADVEVVCTEIRRHLEANGLAAACFAVELATRECLCNAVIHGNDRDPKKRIHLDLRIGRTWLRLQVTDAGPGFNWREVRKVPRDDTARDGRGLAICALYAERVAFNRRGNRISIWIRKRKGGEPCPSISWTRMRSGAS
jgi:anti-sigma regulatory factor (Ser/Thr protein kinase)